MLKTIGRTLMKLHRDDQGADMVEYVLIIAAIALPLLAVVIIFWDNIKEWMYDETEKIFELTNEGTDPSGMPSP